MSAYRDEDGFRSTVVPPNDRDLRDIMPEGRDPSELRGQHVEPVYDADSWMAGEICLSEDFSPEMKRQMWGRGEQEIIRSKHDLTYRTMGRALCMRKCPVRHWCLATAIYYHVKDQTVIYAGMDYRDRLKVARMLQEAGIPICDSHQPMHVVVPMAVKWLDEHPEAEYQARERGKDYWREMKRQANERPKGIRDSGDTEPKRELHSDPLFTLDNYDGDFLV